MPNKDDSRKSKASSRSLQKVNWLISAGRRAALQLDVPLQIKRLILFFFLCNAAHSFAR